MKLHVKLLLVATLCAVFTWAREQQGPTSPSALGTPGGGSLGAAGGVSTGPGGLPILTAHGGKGRGGGNKTPAAFQARLTAGGFIFDFSDVTANNRGTSYTGGDELDMNDSQGDSGTWFNVFDACIPSSPGQPNPLDGITELKVRPGNWHIVCAGCPAPSDIRVRFKDVDTLADERVDISVELIGDTSSGFPFLPEPGNTSSFTLTNFWINGHAKGGKGCRLDANPLLTVPSRLEILNITN